VSTSRRLLTVLGIAALAACHQHTPQARTTLDAARVALRRGDIANAEALANQAVALTGGSPNSVDAWTSVLLRAEVQLARVDLTAAAPALAAAPPAGASFDALRSRQQYLTARAFVIRRDLPQALHALDAASALAPPDDPVRMDIGVLTGQVRLQLGRWDDAESGLRETLARAQSAHDGYRQALALTNLGMARFIRSKWDEALPFFEDVLSFDGLDQFTVYAGALTNAGMCYSRLGQFDRAVAVQQRAVAMYAKRAVPTDYARALGELGNTYVLQGDAVNGLRYLQQALDVSRKSNISTDAALFAGNLAFEYLELGDWDRADELNARALAIRSAGHTGNVVYNTLNAAQIAQGRRQFAKSADLYRDALAHVGDHADIQWASHAGLAAVAVATGAHEEATLEFEAALATIERTRSNLLGSEYRVSFLSRLIEFYQSYVDELVSRGEIERALEVANSSRARVLSERQGVAAPARPQAAAFKRAARNGAATIVFYWLGTHSYAWIITPSAIRCIPLPPASAIDALVRRQQQAIAGVLSDPLAKSNTAGRELYRLLVQPFASDTRAGSSVLVVPDGSLTGLNFETLPVDDVNGSHYWIEDAQVAVAPSIGMPPMPGDDRTQDALLLIGDAAGHAPDFPALRYASPEMTAVAHHFDAGRTVVYRGADASPAEYRAAHPEQFALIHFTAHAEPNAVSPLDSAVVLSGPPGKFKLYARDVADHPLHAELVTISGCRSAGGRAYSGEGLVGFSWAFLRAGARNVIAGLWDVDDQSTVDLMDTLYAGLAGGATVAGALRAAKLALIHRGGGFAKPYYWGTFQLFTRSAAAASQRLPSNHG
jgi:CHAT domain-containing protein